MSLGHNELSIIEIQWSVLYIYIGAIIQHWVSIFAELKAHSNQADISLCHCMHLEKYVNIYHDILNEMGTFHTVKDY